MRGLLLSGALLLSSVAGPPPPLVFHVSTGGDDTVSCAAAQSLSTPRRTITRALECLSAGDTLLVQYGTYTEALTDGAHDFSGTVSAPTIIRGVGWTSPYITAPGATSTEALTDGAHDFSGTIGVGWTSPRITAPGATHVLHLGQRHHVRFENLEFDGTGVVHDAVKLNGSSHHLELRGGRVHHATRQGVNVQDASHSHTITGVYFSFNGTSSFDHGIYLATADNRVAYCRIESSSGYGVHVFDEAEGNADRNLIESNWIARNGRVDGFGILLGSGEGNMAINNVVIQNHGGMQVAHNGARNTRLVHNTVLWNGASGGVVVFPDVAGTVAQNLLADMVEWLSPVSQAGNVVTTTPGVDPQTARLLFQSPAISAGVATTIVVDQAGVTRGSPPDSGAFEFVVPVIVGVRNEE